MFTRLCGLLLLLVCSHAFAAAQAEEFSYQGHLDMNGQPANGSFAMTFALFDAASGGNQVGTTQSRPAVAVSGGTFGVVISYPDAFAGDQLWLEVAVNGQTLGGREKVTAAPVAQFALNGGRALLYKNSTPSTAATPPKVAMNSVGPFSFSGACGISATGAVTVYFYLDSTEAFDFRAVAHSQVNDTGALDVGAANLSGTPAGGVGLLTFTASSGNYKRAWTSNYLVRSLDSNVVVSISLYLSSDARAASTGCVMEGNATLGL